jgi:hypothetical protein
VVVVAKVDVVVLSIVVEVVVFVVGDDEEGLGEGLFDGLLVEEG